MRVLFVGNSYTLYGDVAGQVAALAAEDADGPALSTERVAEGGATLALHARTTGAGARIAEGGFTHVVLQDKSTQPLHDADDFFEHGGALADGAKAAGAEVRLFATWARKEGHAIYRWGWSGRGPAEMTRRVRAAYDELARRTGASVVPVGDVWERARRSHPALRLHDADDHHASPLGSHLTALTLHAWLAEREPRPAGFRPPDVPEETSRTLRQIVAEARRVIR